ncbi:hypothetical protein [uncultured Hydrogenophaga sp.]|uniref:hypothetical protein n=1 Tax=uncultured Hydrogenophaga sp. TaxID=199683 RepID=UPI00265E50AD|nr:hypothetical protein [uncultured Hydrogenophaga sp.]
MAIDVIIPGTTPWVFTNAALAPGETLETAVDLNGRHNFIAEMLIRGYLAGAQIQQASADVQADTAKLALLRELQAGRLGGLDFSTPQAATASRDLLTSLGANLTNPDMPHTGTAFSMVMTGWDAHPLTGAFYLVGSPSTRQVTLALPPIVIDPFAWNQPPGSINFKTVSVPLPAVIDPVYADPSGNLFYVAKHPSGTQQIAYLTDARFSPPRPVTMANVTHIYPTGPYTDAQAKVIAASIDPAKLDAEIDKTIQISQGKQVYLQTLTTDYSNFYTTAGNLIQDNNKLLSFMISRIG